MSMDQNEIVIVGGGIYGASLAYDLTRAGRGVTLLEAEEIACGASGGPGERGVRANNRDLRELPVVALAQRRWKELQETIEGGVGYRRIGGMQVFEVPYGHRASEVRGEVEARAMMQEAMGVPSKVLSRKEVLEIEPEIGAGINGALFCPNDGVGDHTLATRQLAAAAAKAGAVVRTGAKVSKVIHKGGLATAVEIEGGETIPFNSQLILVANAGNPALLEPLLKPEEKQPVWSIMPQMMYVTNPEGRKINHLLGHKNRRLAVKQLPDGTIMLSGGWGVERNEGGGLTGSLSAAALNLNDAIATFPFLDRSAFKTVDATRTETVCIDHAPIIGRPAGFPNVLYGYAWCGHGFAISLGFSKLVTDWIVTGDAPADLEPFSPRRFQRAQ